MYQSAGKNWDSCYPRQWPAHYKDAEKAVGDRWYDQRTGTGLGGREVNGIFRYIFGTILAQVVSAEPGEAISYYTRMGIHIMEPSITAPLTLRLRIPARQWRRFGVLAEARGDACKLLKKHGLIPDVLSKRKRIPFALALCALVVFALYAPSRLWFLRVEGNERVPAGQIEAVARECGLTFWTKVKEISSERFKNLILNEIPELQWAGVNFNGGVATVSVRERLEGDEVRQTDQITNVVASRDGIILSMSVLGGQAVCETGQAVTAGEILVTGCIEHEYQTQYTCADAEVYALTQRKIEAIVPDTIQEKHYTGEEERVVKLILGRNKIKIFGNSGISGTTCDKMTTVKTLKLPGGYALPISLVIETYRVYAPEPISTEDKAEQIMSNYLHDYIHGDMVAGEILDSTQILEVDEGLYRLSATYSCREMIARQWKVTLFEGENTNDGTDRKRGEGGGSD